MPYRTLVPAILAVGMSTMAASSEVGASTVLHCGQLLDVVSGRLLDSRYITVDDNKISAISKTAPTQPYQLVDLSQHTCLPGVMDMHVHLDGELNPRTYLDRFQLGAADIALRAAANAEKTLLSGFTTVRNLGDTANVTIALRRAIQQGLSRGPRIYSAGKTLASTGGHGDPSNGYRPGLQGDPGAKEGVINSPDEARKAVRQRYKDGADVIKITATGGVLSLAANGQNAQFTMAELEAIVSTANDYGMHVAAHAHGAEGIRRAVEAGVTSIEHGTYMTKEIMDMMKERGTFYVPTIAAGRFVAEKARDEDFFPAVIRPKAAAIGPIIDKTFAKAWRYGVKVAYGTDSGVSAHGENAKEFYYMVENGMEAIDAIRSATISAAELLGESHRLGQISPTFLADIIAVNGNPLENIRLLENVSFVMKDGQIYKPPSEHTAPE